MGLVVVLDRGQSDIWKFRTSPFFLKRNSFDEKSCNRLLWNEVYYRVLCTWYCVLMRRYCCAFIKLSLFFNNQCASFFLPWRVLENVTNSRNKLCKLYIIMRFENTFFWDVTSCSLVNDCRRLGITCFLHLLIWRRRQHFLHDVECYLSNSSSRP